IDTVLTTELVPSRLYYVILFLDISSLAFQSDRVYRATQVCISTAIAYLLAFLSLSNTLGIVTVLFLVQVIHKFTGISPTLTAISACLPNARLIEDLWSLITTPAPGALFPSEIFWRFNL